MVLLRNFSPCFPIKRNIKAGFNRKANLVACYLPILSILRRRQAITSTKQLRKILASPKDVFGEATKIQHHFQNLIERIFSFSDIAHSCCEHCFPASAAPRPNISPIMELRVMISEIAFNHRSAPGSDRRSRLRMFPYDPFKIYTVFPIVRI